MPIPKITFIVASYNYEDYLSENLCSLINQWRKDNPFEILVVDDGSSDNSLTIAEKFASVHPFIRVLTHKFRENKGLGASLHLALQYVSTEWTAFLESDDVSKAETVERILSEVNSNSFGLCFFDIEPLIEKNASLGWFNSYVPRMRNLMLDRGADKFAVDLGFEMLKENLIPTFSCALVRTNLLRQCSFDSPVSGWIDWYLWIQSSQKTKVRFIDEKLVKWRLHAGSQNNKKKLVSYMYQYSIFRAYVRQKISKMDVEDKSSKIIFLSLPSIIPLGMRLLKMTGYVGLTHVVKEIYRRIVK